jgi:hypothetical protein
MVLDRALRPRPVALAPPRPARPRARGDGARARRGACAWPTWPPPAPEAERPDLPAIGIEVIDVGVGGDHPTGPRFGTLVHAVLAAIPLDGARIAIAEGADLQARILGASAEETTAAREVVGTVTRVVHVDPNPARPGPG